MLGEKNLNPNTFQLTSKKEFFKSDFSLQVIYLAVSYNSVRMFLPFWWLLWQATFHPLTSWSVQDTTAFSEYIRWHLVRNGHWSLGPHSKTCCAGLLMGLGTPSPSLQNLEELKPQFNTEDERFLFQVTVTHIHRTDQKSLNSCCTHGAYFVTRENFNMQSI